MEEIFDNIRRNRPEIWNNNDRFANKILTGESYRRNRPKIWNNNDRFAHKFLTGESYRRNRPEIWNNNDRFANKILTGETYRRNRPKIWNNNDRFAHKILTGESYLQPDIYGRDEVQEMVMESLISNVEKVTIIPIVGPGGIGKTRLAHWIYSHSTILDKFHIKGWVNCGSFMVDLTFLMKNIHEVFAKKPFDLTDLDSLKRKVQEEVLGRRFLLVLDNVLGETLSMLCDVCALFSGAHLGKIVVTSREENIVNFVKDKVVEHPLVLGCLDNNNSWLMFRDSIHKDHANTAYNYEIGQQLASKCNGLPFSIRALGSALKFESFKQENWQNILASEIWKLDEIHGDGVLPALKVSYSRMHIELKCCFALLSLFPKGHVFYENDVVRLWMSLGLSAQSNFKDLLERSMIENAQGDGENSGFTMHDLIHDIAKFYAGDDFLVAQSENIYSTPTHVRYLSILVSNLTNSVDLLGLKEHQELRVLQIVHQQSKWKNDVIPITKIKLSNGLFRNLIHLKALVLSMTHIESLPVSIENLKLLRYLDLKNTGIERLPDNICNLYYLQTLDVSNCPLRELPEGIKNLVNLQYLVFQWKFSLCMPHGIGRLKRLRVLPRFDIKKGNWHCNIAELEGLQDLSGELCIAGLGNTTSAREKILQNKPNLKVLRLDWSTGPGPCSHLRKGNGADACASDLHARESAEYVFQSLKPCTNLEALYLYGYPGFKSPSWLGDASSDKLVKISLVGTGEGLESVRSSIRDTDKSCETLPLLGSLPSLKALFIKSMWNVPTVAREFYGRSASFPSLEILSFDDMFNWVEWHAPESIVFESLRTLRITDCPKLNRIPYPLSSSSTKMVSLYLKGELNEDLFRFLHLPSLRTLKVCFSANIRSLPLDSQNIPSLEVLVIHRCRKLQTIFGLGELESVEVIEIHGCEKLQFSLNEQLPPRLRNLTISDCPKLEKWKLLQKGRFDDQKHGDELEGFAQLSDTYYDADIGLSMERGGDEQFPVGLRVLVVDDDVTSLTVLKQMLLECHYYATTCSQAKAALSLLRESKEGFHVVLSTAQMLDMNGFRLIELAGLEMDLPVIMMSADAKANVVMEGIKHGACDYLIKPVQMEELKNIWQHSATKRRIVWSVELHQQFVNAVNQLGIDKAVPKRILELMNVSVLTTEDVANHLQKFRLYFEKLSGVAHHHVDLQNPFFAPNSPNIKRSPLARLHPGEY